MNSRISKRDKITLAVFVFVTLTAGIFGYLIDQVLIEQPEGNSLGMGLWLVLPCLTGIILHIINKDMKTLGVRLNFRRSFKYYLVAIFIFPAIMLVSVIASGVTGSLTVKTIEISGLIVLMISTFFLNVIKNIFEEFAWRGCLVPFLEKIRINDWCLYFFSGLIWGMWHITYYMFFLPDTYFTQISRPAMVIEGIILMICWSPLFVELRKLSNSVWPCVILHSMEDAGPTLFFVTTDVFRINERVSFLLDPVSGILPTVLLVLAGIGLRRYRLNREKTINNS